MLLPAGTYKFGPANGSLTVRTGKGGAAAKAGHNLLIEVTGWSATLELGETSALSVSVDSRSLRVLEGTGGIQALGEDDKASIAQTIDEEVLQGTPIEFRSSHVEFKDGVFRTQGELELCGRRAPIAFALRSVRDHALGATAKVKQTDWGIKPYSALFGTLKVADEVEITAVAEVAVAADPAATT